MADSRTSCGDSGTDRSSGDHEPERTHLKSWRIFHWDPPLGPSLKFPTFGEQMKSLQEGGSNGLALSAEHSFPFPHPSPWGVFSLPFSPTLQRPFLCLCDLFCEPTSSTAHFFHFCAFLFLKRFLNLFLEKGEGKERRGTLMCGCLSCAPYWGHMACNPGMCPDMNSNRRPFDS